MDSLPSELLCYILSKLDGRSLAQAARVNQQWHAVVEILGKAFNIWYKRCIKEMGLDAMVESTGLVLLYNAPGRHAIESKKDSWRFWRRVYAGYQRSLSICRGQGVRSVKTVSMQEDKGYVWKAEVIPTTDTHHMKVFFNKSCTKEEDRIRSVVFGTLNDMQDAFHEEGSYSHGPHKVAQDIILVSVGGCIGCPTGKGEVETFLLTCGYDGHIFITDGEGRTWDGHNFPHLSGFEQVYNLASLGSYFAVGHSNSITRGIVISKIVLKEPRKNGRLSPGECPFDVVGVIKLKGMGSSCVEHLAFTHTQLVAAVGGTTVYRWTFSSLSNFEGVMSNSKGAATKFSDETILTVKEPDRCVNVEEHVTGTIINSQETLVLTCTCKGENILVILRERDSWSTMVRLRGDSLVVNMARVQRITCMAASGPLLAFGTLGGYVLLYNRADERALYEGSQKALVATFYAGHSSICLKFFDDAEGKKLLTGGSIMRIHTWKWPGRSPDPKTISSAN